ncbi:hypothetical protein C0J50_2333 [Silurus asotus]|uniref:Uncharacterized protein n=1 Tax=Silurus asotus TaxID=30991 RepID=A0AAD5B688_SILAS|nr:hypothetical protein C0J50_2333 [Silurus asotus]
MVKAIQPDKGQRGGPSHSIANVLESCYRGPGIRSTSSGVSSDPERCGETKGFVLRLSILGSKARPASEKCPLRLEATLCSWGWFLINALGGSMKFRIKNKSFEDGLDCS